MLKISTKNFLKGSWFLDVDLDYFSVDDPFTHDINEEDLKKISNLYAVGESPKDEAPEEEHDSYQRLRMLKITKIENELKKWDQDFQRFDNEEVVSDDPDIIEAFKLWKVQREVTNKAILVSGEDDALMREGWLIHNAGCTTNCDGPALPVHKSSESEILKMIKDFISVVAKQVEILGLPGGICLARSSLDGYCPPDQVEFIQENVLASLTDLFQTHNAALDVNKFYLKN